MEGNGNDEGVGSGSQRSGGLGGGLDLGGGWDGWGSGGGLVSGSGKFVCLGDISGEGFRGFKFGEEVMDVEVGVVYVYFVA